MTTQSVQCHGYDALDETNSVLFYLYRVSVVPVLEKKSSLTRNTANGRPNTPRARLGEAKHAQITLGSRVAACLCSRRV